MSGAWTDEQWALLFDLLDNGWPGELDPSGAEAYRVLLDGTDPDTVVAGLRRLLHGGARFRPSAAEILSSARRDPSRPTFGEMLQLVEHCLRARPARTGAVTTYKHEADRLRQFDAAILERAQTVHPLVCAFIHRQGIDRLRTLGLNDPDYGGVRRRDFEAEWNDHVETFEGRDVAALAAPRGTGGQLKKFDPLAALGRGDLTVPALAAGETTEGAT
jgi:hypothetical protein